MKVRFAAFISILVFFSLNIQSPANAAGQQGLSMVVRGNLNYNNVLPPYNDSINFDGKCLQDTVPNISFFWDYSSPGGCPVDNFTIYFNGFIKAPRSGTVYFYNQSDDGFYMTINDSTVINNWTDQSNGGPNASGSFQMIKDQIYSIKVWYYERSGGATVTLWWNTMTNSFGTAEIVPTQNFATDPTFWGPVCSFKGNSGTASNSVGALKSSSPAALTSQGAGACQNAATR